MDLVFQSGYLSTFTLHLIILATFVFWSYGCTFMKTYSFFF